MEKSSERRKWKMEKSSVIVVNMRKVRPAGMIKCDRGTPVGNKFIIGKDGDRDEVIRKYHIWFGNEVRKEGPVKDFVESLLKVLEIEEILILGCWCKPKRCHVDVIKNWITEILRREEIS